METSLKIPLQLRLSSKVTRVSGDHELSLRLSYHAGYAGLTAPMLKDGATYVPNYKYRYLSEDIPRGLCVVKGIALLLNISTPSLDKIIAWGQLKLQQEYKFCSHEGSLLMGNWPGKTLMLQMRLRR